jgi:hypothetical protein
MDSNAPHPTSHPNAGKLVELARTFAGVMAPTLAKQFPKLFQGPQAAEWPFFCTVGCTWIACVALHHSVPAESRAPTEVTVQRTLAEWHPAAMAAYEHLQQFVLEKLAPEDDAGKRREVLELDGGGAQALAPEQAEAIPFDVGDLAIRHGRLPSLGGERKNTTASQVTFSLAPRCCTTVWIEYLTPRWRPRVFYSTRGC